MDENRQQDTMGLARKRFEEQLVQDQMKDHLEQQDLK